MSSSSSSSSAGDIREDYSSSINGKVLLAAVVLLCLVVSSLLLLHICAKLYWRQRRGEDLAVQREASFRRRQRRRMRFAQSGETLETTPAQGLDRTIIDSLPLFAFQKKSLKKSTEASKNVGLGLGLGCGVECSVCLCEFEEGEKARILPQCNHTFHMECIDMWFFSHSTCPLCRASVHAPSDTPLTNTLIFPTEQPLTNSSSSSPSLGNPNSSLNHVGPSLNPEGTDSNPEGPGSNLGPGLSLRARSLPQNGSFDIPHSFSGILDLPLRCMSSIDHRNLNSIQQHQEFSRSSPSSGFLSLKRLLSLGRGRQPPLNPPPDNSNCC